VEHIEIASLKLSSEYDLILKNTVYVPSMRRNLISISVLDKCLFTFVFGSDKVENFRDSNLVGSDILSNCLYLLNLEFVYVVQRQSDICSDVCSKRGRPIETSSMLCHRRLGHISKERMKRLINKNNLHNLNFSNFDRCVDCVKGKLTAKTKKTGVSKRKGVSHLIHIYICDSITHVALGEYR